jgi:hypothetical protein
MALCLEQTYLKRDYRHLQILMSHIIFISKFMTSHSLVGVAKVSKESAASIFRVECVHIYHEDGSTGGISETIVTTFATMWCHNPEDYNLIF